MLLLCLFVFVFARGGLSGREHWGEDGALCEVCEVNVVGDSVVTRPQTSHCGAPVSVL